MRNSIFGSHASTALLLAVALAFATAGVYIGLFNDLAYDDFGRAANTSAYTTKVSSWYRGHNGRFANALIVSPTMIYKLPIYRLLHIVNLFFWVGCLISLNNQILRKARISCENRYLDAIKLSALVFLATFINSPNLGEWWFWFASSSVYLTGSAFLMAAISASLVASSGERLTPWIISGVGYFLAAGSHEVLSLLAFAISFCLALCWFKYFRFRSLIPLFFAALGFGLLVLAPGSNHRHEAVSGQPLTQRLWSVFTDIARLEGETLSRIFAFWTQDYVWLFVALCAFLLGWSAKRSKNSENKLRSALCITLAISVISVLLLPVLPIFLKFKVDFIGPTRLASFGYFIFIFIIALNAFLSGLILSHKVKANRNGAHSFDTVLTTSSLIVLVWLLGASMNTRIMFEDIAYKKGLRQSAAIDEWRKLSRLDNNATDTLVLPGLIPANTLVVARYGPKLDSNYPMNMKWANYLGRDNQHKISVQHFDKSLLGFIKSRLNNSGKLFRAEHFQDEFRSYLLVRTKSEGISHREFCLTLGSDGGSISKTVYDESFSNLPFAWSKNVHCTDFVSRKVYCQPELADWICRIPLPMDYSGPISVSWQDVDIVIQSRDDYGS